MKPTPLDRLARGSRVLLIRLRSLGDCVLTTPAIHLLKSFRPDLEIGVVVEERFRYGEPPGIHVAFLRVYRLSEPWRIADEPRYGGCRSWVALPVPPEGIAMEAVLDDAAHAARAAEIRRVLG